MQVFASAAAFINLAAIADVSSSALEEEEVSSASFNNLLLLILLSSETSERLPSYFLFFSLFSSEGLDLTFWEDVSCLLGVSSNAL